MMLILYADMCRYVSITYMLFWLPISEIKDHNCNIKFMNFDLMAMKSSILRSASHITPHMKAFSLCHCFHHIPANSVWTVKYLMRSKIKNPIESI